jgi:hypothetical protein
LKTICRLEEVSLGMVDEICKLRLTFENILRIDDNAVPLVIKKV